MAYEKRLLLYADILGWREEIAREGLSEILCAGPG